ncbi:glycosyltransferase 87 family protein [Streptomyces sp. NBC_01571]|uniref:glycosyltransferase family 87 protein n=1 Tax=Streptomyces sp. NBC_01571 TaxID=2975883 RepID=UPI00224CB46D|nr:glycosyltransferase 87 family protein [Streptomyces sp. NBC_01571]MCX4575814.1 glycosyltransferase 87 family protein [Streptomyces sp. NBC_01571]
MLQRKVITRSPTGADAGRPLASAAAAALLAVSLAAFAALCVLQRAPMADALVYRAEGAAVAHGTDLYGFTVTEWRLPATYPPFAALLFVPAAWLAPPTLKVVFVLGNTVLLAVLVRLSFRLAGLSARLPAVCAASALTLWLEPVFQSVLFGQINLALVCLILWDLSRPPGARGRGVALGIAAGVKLTPVLFIAYLMFTGRRREARTAAGTFAGTVLLGAFLLPAASVDFWTRRLYETGRVGKPWIVDNQSLQGLIARVMGEPSPGPAWALPAAAVGCAGLWLSCTRTTAAARNTYAARASHAEKDTYAEQSLYAENAPYTEKSPYAAQAPHVAKAPHTSGTMDASEPPHAFEPPHTSGLPHMSRPPHTPGTVPASTTTYVSRTTYAPDRVPVRAGRAAPATGPHPDRWGVLGTAFTALLVSPISWSHHWVWCVPLIAVLYAGHGPRPAAAVAAVFTARTLWLIPHQGDLDLRLPWWQQPLASPYPLLGLLVLAQLSASSSSASRIR